MNQEYDLSKIKQRFKTQVEEDLNKTFSEIDFEGIFNKILGKLGLKISNIDFNSEAVQNALRKAFIDAFNGGITEAVQDVKSKKYNIDLSEMFKLNSKQLLAEVEKTYQDMQDAINKKDKKLQNQLQQRLVELVSYGQGANYRGFDFDDNTKNKTDWQRAYNGIISGFKSSEQMAAKYKEISAQIKEMVHEKGIELLNKNFAQLDLSDWTDDAKNKIQAAFIEIKNDLINNATFGDAKKKLLAVYDELNQLPKKEIQTPTTPQTDNAITQTGEAADVASKKVGNLIDMLTEYKRISDSMEKPKFSENAQEALDIERKYATGLGESLDEVKAKFLEELELFKKMKIAYKSGGAVSFIDALGSSRLQNVRKEDLEDQKKRLVAMMSVIKNEGDDPFQYLNKTLTKDLSKSFENYTNGLREATEESKRVDVANEELERSLDKIDNAISTLTNDLNKMLGITSVLADLKGGFTDVETAASKIDAIINKPESGTTNVWQKFQDEVHNAKDEVKQFAEEYKVLLDEYHNFSDEEAGIKKIQDRLKELYSFRKNEGFEKQFGNEIVSLMDMLKGAGASIENKNIEKYFSARFQEARALLIEYSKLSELAPVSNNYNPFAEWEHNLSDTRTLEEFANQMSQAQSELNKFYANFPSKEKIMDSLYYGYDEVGQKYDELAQRLSNGSINAETAINELNQVIANGVPFSEKYLNATKQNIENTNEQVEADKKVVKASEEAAKAEVQMGEQGEISVKKVAEQQNNLQSKIDETIKSIEKEKASLQSLENIINGNISFKNKKEATEALKHWYNELINQENNGRISDKTVMVYMNVRKAAEELGVAQSSLDKYFNPIAVSQYEHALKNVKGSYDVTCQVIKSLESELQNLQKQGQVEIFNKVPTSEEAVKAEQNLAEETNKANTAIEEQKQKVTELENVSKETQQTEQKGFFNEELLNQYINTLKQIADVLNEVRNAIGTVDDNNGFKNIIESLNTTLAKLNEISQKVGTGVFNVQINKGDDVGIERKNNIIRDERSRLQNIYKKAVEKAGSEELLYANIYTATAQNFSGGLDALYKAYSPINVSQIQSVEEQVYRLRQFFDVLREAMKSPVFSLDLKGLQLPAADDSAFRAKLKNATAINQETVAEANQLQDILGNTNNDKLGESLTNALTKLQELIPSLNQLSNIKFDGLAESLDKINQTDEDNAFVKLQTVIEKVNEALVTKNELLEEEIGIVNSNLPFEINEFDLLDKKVESIDNHIKSISQNIRNVPGLNSNGNDISNNTPITSRNPNQAYRSLVKDEVRYQNLLARQADNALSLNAKEKEDLAVMQGKRNEYINLLRLSPELSAAYERERQTAQALAQQYVKDQHIDNYIKQYQKLEAVISNVATYSEDSRVNASNLLNNLPKVDQINNSNINDIKAYNEQLKDMLANMDSIGANKAFEVLSKTEHTYQQLLAKQADGQLTATENDRLSQLQQERDLYEKLIISVDEVKQKYEELQAQAKSDADVFLKNKAIDEYIKKYEKLQQVISDTKKYTPASITDIQTRISEIGLPDTSSVNSLSVDKIREFNKEIDNLLNSVGKLGNETKLRKIIIDIDKALDQNTRMPAKMANQFSNLRAEVEKLLASGNYLPEQVKEMSNSFLKLESQMIRTGKTGRSFFSMIKNDIVTSSARTISMYMSFYRLIGYVRSAITAIKDLDSALTQLQIVSGATESELQSVSNTAFELANRLGSTTTEVVSSITEWRRLGKTISESTALAEQAQKLATGGMMDVNSATTALISSMQAFDIGVEDVSKVVDQYIYLGNNYAITSEDLASSLTKSTAALKVAGNSLEQIEALEIAGNTIVQDADVVSNSLKVLSMRLRGTTGSALEEIGEDTEGLIENFSKLNKKIQDLTKTADNPEGVSIVDKQTKAYKSTYQILLDISKVWKDIGDMQKAELLEVIAGKTRATAAAAILESPETLQSAYNDAMFSSEGAGTKAVETAVESIESKINILRNNLKKLGQEIIGSDVVKDVTDNLTTTIQEINKSANNIRPVIQLLSELFNTILKVVGALPSGGIMGAVLGIKNRNSSLGMNILQGVSNSGIFKNFQIVQESDVKLFQQYSQQIEEGKSHTDAWNNSMKYANKTARNFADTQLKSGKTIPEVTAGLEQQTKATTGLRIASSALNMAITMGLSMAITAIVSGVSKAVHAEEEFKKSTQELASTFKSFESDLTSQGKKIQELNDKLKDSNTTAEEAVSCREDLLKIQKELFEKYGNEANAIDLITQALNGEIEALEKLKKLKWEDTLNEFNETNKTNYFAKSEGFWDYFLSAFDFISPVKPAADMVIEAIDEAYADASLSKSPAQAAYERWLNGDDEYADFAKLYMQYEVLPKQYKGQYDQLVALEKEYEEKLINGELTDDVKKAYADSYQEILDSITDSKVAEKIGPAFFSSLVTNKTEYDKWAKQQEELANEIKTKRDEILQKKILGRDDNGDISADRQFTNNGLITKSSEGVSPSYTIPKFNVKEIEDAFNELEIDTQKELDIMNQAIEQATELGYNNVNDLFDLYKSLLTKANFEPKELISYSSWLEKNSSIKNGKDSAKNYTNNELINAYETSLNSLKDYIEQDEQGQIKVDFGKVVQFTTSDNLFQQLGMDNFENYMKEYGSTYEAIFAYILDAEQKLKDSLDKDFEDNDILYETLYNIRDEALGGSISVYKLEESYQELNNILERVGDGERFNKEQMTEWINKYPELKSAVKKYGVDSYSLQEESLKNLIDTYIELENTSISTMLQAKKKTLEATIATANLGMTVEQLVASYKSMFDEAGKLKQDISGHDYEYMYGDLTGTGKTRQQIEKDIKEYAALKELAEKALRETSGSSDKDKSNDDNKSNLDWLDVYLEKYNRKVDETQKKLENLDKTTIFKDLPKKLKKQLNALGEGGNVNLKLRPEIDTEKLKDAGWEDIAEGYATVFTSTFSNATEDVAVNFTPIIVDPKTGEYLGVLSPDELQKYAEEVIAGVRKDDLNLQIGASFTGADAIKQAEKAAKKIHKLHEKIHNLNYDIEGKYYDQREKQIKNVNEALEKQREAEKVAEEEYARRMNKGELYNDLKEAAGSKKAADEYIKKIKAGEDIDLESMDSDLSSAIQALIDNWNKKNEAADKQIEIGIQIKENELQLVKDRIDEVVSQYDKFIALFERRQQELEHYQTMSTTMGHMENEKYYFALIENETRELADNIAKRDELAQELENFTPTTKEELDYWYELKGKVDEATDAIWENQEAIASWQEAVKKLEWELDDKIAELTYGVMDETNFLIDHLSSSDMYEYDRQYLGNDANKSKIYSGQMSDAGKATLALRFANYKAYLEQIEDYNKRIAEAEALYMQDTSNLENLERLNELKRMQQQVIQGYDAEKQAIIDLIKEGYDKQLESLQTLIDKYMEALQAEKDLYSYQKSIEKQTKNIADIRKRMMAYANDSSEEAKMKLQQLQVQLEEAEESRADMEYQRRLQDQQELLDRMYQSLEDYFDDKLEDTDKLLEDSKKILEDSMPDIQTTLQESLKFDQDTSADISDTLKNILNGNITAVGAYVSQTDADINALKESVVGSTADLERYYASYQLTQDQKKDLYNWISNLNTQANNFLGENGGFEKFIGRFNSGVIDIIDAIKEKELIDKLDDTGETISESMGTLFSYWGEYLGQNSVPTPVVDNNLKSIISTANKPAPNVNISTSISLDNVTDYKSFINECKKDKTFEKLVQEITVNRLYGNSNSLSKRNI